MESLELLKQTRLPFAELIGVRLIAAAPDRVTAELNVREELCTNPAVLHGGALMAPAARRPESNGRRRGHLRVLPDLAD